MGRTIKFRDRFQRHLAPSGQSALKQHLEICEGENVNLKSNFSFKLLEDMHARGKYTLGEREDLWIWKTRPSINIQKPY